MAITLGGSNNLQLRLGDVEPALYLGDQLIYDHNRPFIPVEAVKILTIISKNKTLQLAGMFTPMTASDKTIIWQSSRTDIVAIDSDGMITPRNPGTAVIKAIAHNGILDHMVVRIAH